MRKRRNAPCFCFLALSFLLSSAASVSGNPPPGTDSQLDFVTLHLKWKHQFQFAGYYAAVEQGFYREAGLDVTIVEATTDTESTGQVLNGNADFGIAMCDLICLRAKGERVVALGSIFQHSPMIILAPKRNGIENIHDLKGKRLALEAHSDQILSYLESEGLPASRLIIHPHDYGISKLVSGEVDAISAYSTDEPFLLAAEGIDYSIFSPRAGGIDFYGDILFTSEQQIEEHPERVAAFVAASLKGWAYALDHTDEVVDLILAEYSTRHSREHLLFEARMSKRLIMRDVVELGYMNPGRWVHIANSFKEMDRIPNGFSLKGFIYDRYPAADHRWLYLSFAGSLAVAGLAFLLMGRFYKLNRKLKWEIEQRQISLDELRKANAQIKTLHGFLPICMHCKQIRDGAGSWGRLERYISQHSDIQFSHGICDSCMKELYPEQWDQKRSDGGVPETEPT